MKCFALHSYKGGTGKTTLGANIAALLAQKGKNVAMLDLDFQAPSLHTLFGVSPKTKYINDFLAGEASHKDILQELSTTFELKGKLSVAFSNPNVEAIRSQLGKDRKWHMTALSQLLNLKKTLESEGYHYLIIDSAPGVHYSSVNAIVLSDFTVIIVKMDNFDFDGTLNMLAGLYDQLDKQTVILFNKVVPTMFEEPHESQMRELAEETFAEKSQILDFITCYCMIPMGMGSEIHALTQPNIPFVKTLKKVVTQLAKVKVPPSKGGKK